MIIDETNPNDLYKVHLLYMKFYRQMNQEKIKGYNRRYFKKTLTKRNKKTLINTDDKIKSSLTINNPKKGKSSDTEQNIKLEGGMDIWN